MYFILDRGNLSSQRIIILFGREFEGEKRIVGACDWSVSYESRFHGIYSKKGIQFTHDGQSQSSHPQSPH